MKNKINIFNKCHYLARLGGQTNPNYDRKLLSNCPKCNAKIRTPYANFCTICGIKFQKEFKTIKKGELE